MIITFNEENDANDEAKSNALSFTWTYNVRVLPADYLLEACGGSAFDAVVLEVAESGLTVGRVVNEFGDPRAEDADDPDFDAAHFGWEDIKEVHIY